MGFRIKLFHLVCVIYLFWVPGLLAQQDNPCATTNADEANGVCGLNGICQVSGQSHDCTCAPGFQFVDTDIPSKGCTQNASQLQMCGAKGAKMETIEQIDWSGNDYEELKPTNQTACKKACIDDCFCIVAIYADLGDGGHCWKKAMPLRKGGASPTRISFVKVYGGVAEAVPPPPPTPLPKVIKEEKGKGLAVAGISLMGCSLIIAVIVLFVWLLICRPKRKSSQEDQDEVMLSDWVYICFKRGKLAKLFEQQDCTGMEVKQLERMVLVGLWCVQEDPSLRPSIKKVLQMLEGTVEIPVPPNPGSSLSHTVNNLV
ncbi:hypothetical protein SUGI_0715900 [Cryptomeria japonica]|nr:hypothetical protein SUGI_0715900 [Cryptomeria japonica]